MLRGLCRSCVSAAPRRSSPTSSSAPPSVAASDAARRRRHCGHLEPQRTGALEADESLTPLGRHLAALPCEVGVGRLIIFGALLKCAQPIMLIAAALSDRSPFLSPLGRRDEARAAHQIFHREQSDHCALLEAHRRWADERRQRGNGAARKFCDRFFLSERTLQGMSDAAEQYRDQLVELGLLTDTRRMAPDAKERVRAAESANGDSPLVLKAVLCSGLFPNVLRALPGKKFPQLTHGKQTVQVHPSSFNRDVNKFETPYLVYHEKVQSSGKIFVHDCSGTTALDLILFGAEPQVLHAQHRVLIDGWIEMRLAALSRPLQALRRSSSTSARASAPT